MKSLAFSLLAIALAVVLQAQSAPPSSAPVGARTPRPYRARPVIVVNPKDYLTTPTPKPHRRAIPPGKRRPLSGPTPQVFEHYDTASSPAPSR